MGIVYVSDSDDDQVLLTPEITAANTKSVKELANYTETYLRLIREDLMRMMDGTWRFIVVDDQIEAQQFNSTTELWVKKFRVRGDG